MMGSLADTGESKKKGMADRDWGDTSDNLGNCGSK